MANSHIPNFGSWKGKKAIQFTKSFDNARKDRSVAGFNPNDQALNPQAFMPSLTTQEQQQKSSSKMAQIDPPRLSTSKMGSHTDTDKRNVHHKPPSLPKFGGWDESGQKAEYTVIFTEVKEKKQTAASQLPPFPTNKAGSNKNKKDEQKTSSMKLCCFCP